MAQNLFALSQGGAASEANKPLVSFRAGKCTFANGTVTPINKKGQVQVLQTPDSLLHFQWKDRTTGTTEDDLIIFPDEATFNKVTQTTGRVFLLKFTSGRKMFFWMQEPKDDKDKEYEEKINQYINNPPVPDQSAGSDRAGGLGNLPGLAGMDRAQLMQMFQGLAGNSRSPHPVGQSQVQPQTQPQTQPAQQSAPSPHPSAHSTSTPQPTPLPKPVQEQPQAQLTTTQPQPHPQPPQPQPQPQSQSQASSQSQPKSQSNKPNTDAGLSQDALAASLSSILAGFGIPNQGSNGEDTDLQEVLVPESVFPILTSNPDALQELYPHLPEGTQNLAGLRELLFSAQFGQTIDALAHLINSGQANELLAMFGFDPMLAGPVGVIDMNGFITVLQSSLGKNAPK